MDFWKYYSGNKDDLKPKISKYKFNKKIAVTMPDFARSYVQKHGKIFPEGEAILATTSESALFYACIILHGRFPAGEAAIAKHPRRAYLYAKDVLNGERFELGEPTIAKNSGQACLYAKNIIKGPWTMGEEAISKDKFNSKWYTDNVLKKDFILNGKLICKYEPDDYDYDA